VTARTPSATITTVLDLLARQRSAATYSGSMLPTLQDRLALLEQDMLLELRLPGSDSAYLLFQRGWIVYAQWQQTVGAAALDPIHALAPLASLRAIPLASAAATLAFAVVGGSLIDPSVLGVGAAAPHDLQAQLTRLRTWHFSGVLTHSTGTHSTGTHGTGAPAGSTVNVWQIVQGRLAAQSELSHDGSPFPLLLAWDDRLLPRLNAPAALPPPLPEALPQPPASALRTPAAPGLPGDTEIWTLFQSVTQAQLGAAAARLIRLMHDKHGTEHGEQLLEALGRQIDRIANKKVGQQFRIQLATPIPSLTIPREPT
jgi:hypothetical protein